MGIPKPAPSRPPSLLPPPSPPSPKRLGWLHLSSLDIHEQRKQRNVHPSTIRPCAAAASATSPELSVPPSPLYLEASSLSSLFFLTSSACLSCGGEGRREGRGGHALAGRTSGSPRAGQRLRRGSKARGRFVRFIPRGTPPMGQQRPLLPWGDFKDCGGTRGQIVLAL